uniref:Uncharacterized protein n=1 Tax=Anopheles dirus TaxID=7168 RepID=A0A182N0D8_9DIPT
MLLFVLLLVTVVSWATLAAYRQRQRLKRLAVRFGGPEPHWLLGHLPQFPANDIPGIFEMMVTMHARYGQDLFNWGLLNDHMIIVSSAANVEKVAMARQTQKSQIYEFIEPWLGQGLLISKGEKWFHRRKIITPTFHFQILESFADVFNREVSVLVETLRPYATSGREFDIYEPVSLYALDSICETSMGVAIDAQRNPNNQYVRDVKRMSELILLRIFHVLASFPRLYSYIMPNAWEQRRLIARLHAFTDSVIQRRRQQLLAEKGRPSQAVADDPYEGGKRRQTFLDLLLDVTVDGRALSDLDIREEVDTFMFEGHDTTTSGIAFTFYQLAKHPDVQEKLYQEIRDVLGADYRTVPLTYSTLQNFTYLDMVVKESLRLLPPVSFIGRRLVEDIEMNGVTIPAGTDFTIPIYVIHRNPAVYPDPERFDPERFSDHSTEKRGPYDYIPFSIGSRNCIGQRYALLEMKITIVQMLAHYRILPGERMPQVRLKTDLVLRPDRGIPIKLQNAPGKMSTVLLVLVTVLAVFGLAQVYRKRRRLQRIARHFDGPAPHWLLGNVLEYPANDIPGIFETMVALHARYGQDLFNWGLLNDYMITVSSPANVEKVVMARQTQKSSVYDFIELWLGQGLLISKGEKWFHRRKIITPTFHFQILESFADVFNREAVVLIEKLRVHARTGQEFDIYEPMNGVTIPAGTDFTIPIYVIHRNPAVYPDPERFDPERFSDHSTEKRGPYDYIPFSIGSRNCIGQRYALLEMKVAIVRMVSFYRILPGDTMHAIRLKTDLVLRPDKTLPIKVTARG